MGISCSLLLLSDCMVKCVQNAAKRDDVLLCCLFSSSNILWEVWGLRNELVIHERKCENLLYNSDETLAMCWPAFLDFKTPPYLGYVLDSCLAGCIWEIISHESRIASFDVLTWSPSCILLKICWRRSMLTCWVSLLPIKWTMAFKTSTSRNYVCLCSCFSWDRQSHLAAQYDLCAGTWIR